MTEPFANILATHHIDTLYRQEARRIYATLVRLVRDMDLAEEQIGDGIGDQCADGEKISHVHQVVVSDNGDLEEDLKPFMW